MRNVSEFINYFIIFGEVQGSCIYVAFSIIEVDAIEAASAFPPPFKLVFSE
jgi:hypothetical protein